LRRHCLVRHRDPSRFEPRLRSNPVHNEAGEKAVKRRRLHIRLERQRDGQKWQDAGHGPETYGKFLNALISFILIAAAIFFFVVKPMNVLAARRAAGQEPEAEPAPTVDQQLLTEIRDLLKAR